MKNKVFLSLITVASLYQTVFAACAANVDMGGNKIVNVGAPTDPDDVATKGYVDDGIKFIDGNNTDDAVYLDGKVGIGTDNPEYTLDIYKDSYLQFRTLRDNSSGTSNWVNELYSSSVYGPTFLAKMAKGSKDSPEAIEEGTHILQLTASPYNGSDFIQNARIYFDATQDYSDTAMGSSIKFFTTENNTTSMEERMIISDKGHLGLGVQDPQSRFDVSYESTKEYGFTLVNQNLLVNPDEDTNTYYIGSSYDVNTPDTNDKYTRGLVGSVSTVHKNGTGRAFVGDALQALYYQSAGQGDYIGGVNAQTNFSGSSSIGYSASVSARTNISDDADVGSAVTFSSYINTDSSKALDTATLLWLRKPEGNGDITDLYGIYIEDMSSRATSKNYSIYSKGGINYFEGNIGIGIDDPKSRLSIKDLPSGATSSDAVSGDTSGLAGAVCITNDGNVYIDTDGTCGD